MVEQARQNLKLADLRQRYEEAYPHIVPLWEAVCADAKRKVRPKDEMSVCSME